MPSAQQVLLGIHCKRTDNVDLKTPILTYIRETYSDRDADDAVDDLTVIQNTRNDIVVGLNGSQTSMRESLTKYYRCLSSVETRFPISSERGQVRLGFSWYDAFRPTKKTTQYNIQYEKGSVLFNVAACLSQLALAADRNSAEGLKTACNLFQESCGAYKSLKENESTKVDAPKPVDLSAECLIMLEKLMLCQAQECVYHNAVLNKKTATVVARLARQTSTMYTEICSMFTQPVLLSHFDKSWVSHCQMKASLYDVESLVQQGKGYRDEDKVGNSIAVWQEAFKRVQTTKKSAKAVSQEMLDSVNRLQDSIQVQLGKAENDNASVYLERVPNFLDLPVLQGACLVKPVVPSDLDPTQEVLFSSLIPESSTKALSKYTDMVDQVVRELMDKLAGATDQARIRLKELELPDLLDALDANTHAALPDGLLAEMEEIQSIGGVQHLREILGEIAELRRHVEGDLANCQNALDEEAKKDAECRNKYSDKWTPPPSASLAKHFWDKITTYRSTLTQAGESDKKVVQKLVDNEAMFQALTPDVAAQHMPRLQVPLVNLSTEDPASVVAGLRRNMETLNHLSSERAGLEEAIKEAKTKDNILPKLMSVPSSGFDQLFDREIKKYDELKAQVDKNCQANAQVLAALSQGAQSFRTLFEVNSWRQACEAAASSTRTGVRQFREVLDHLSEGLRFYMGVQEAVKSHLQTCTDFAYTRQLQRDDVVQELDRQRTREEQEHAQRMANLAITPPSNPSPTPPAYPQPPPAPQYQYPGATAQPPPSNPPPYGAPQQPPAYGGYAPAAPPYQQPAQQGYYQSYPPQAPYGAPYQAPQPYHGTAPAPQTYQAPPAGPTGWHQGYPQQPSPYGAPPYHPGNQ